MPEIDAPEAEEVETETLVETVDTETDAGKEGQPFDPEIAKAKIAKVNSEAANLRKRLRELEPLAAKAKELEDANKSDTEKLTERVTAAEKEAGTTRTELMRLRVGMRKGLTEKQAARLVGATVEELEADADELLESFGGAKGKPAPKVAGKPTERLRGGTDPDEPVEETDPRKLAQMITRRN